MYASLCRFPFRSWISCFVPFLLINNNTKLEHIFVAFVPADFIPLQSVKCMHAFCFCTTNHWEKITQIRLYTHAKKKHVFIVNFLVVSFIGLLALNAALKSTKVSGMEKINRLDCNSCCFGSIETLFFPFLCCCFSFSFSQRRRDSECICVCEFFYGGASYNMTYERIFFISFRNIRWAYYSHALNEAYSCVIFDVCHLYYECKKHDHHHRHFFHGRSHEPIFLHIAKRLYWSMTKYFSAISIFQHSIPCALPFMVWKRKILLP